MQCADLGKLTNPRLPGRIRRIKRTWNEATVTLPDLQASFDPIVVATIPTLDTGERFQPTTSTSLSSLIDGWVNERFPNDGLLVEDLNTRGTQCRSSEAASGGPALAVCFVPPDDICVDNLLGQAPILSEGPVEGVPAFPMVSLVPTDEPNPNVFDPLLEAFAPAEGEGEGEGTTMAFNDGGDDQFDGANTLQIGDGFRLPVVFPTPSPISPVLAPDCAEGSEVRLGQDDELDFVEINGGVVHLEETVVIPPGTDRLLFFPELRGDAARVLVLVDGVAVATRNLLGVDVFNEGISVDVSALVGATVTVRFELDNVVGVLDGFVGANLTDGFPIENSRFSSGFDDWTVNIVTAAVRAPNLTSSVDFDGLTITRSIFAVPTTQWLRYVDTFTNTGVDPIVVPITYESDLGSDGDGVVYPRGGALVSWDLSGGDRDLALVYGNGFDFDFETAADFVGNDAEEASDFITAQRTLTINPGQTQTVVTFVFLGVGSTANTAIDENDQSVEVNALVDDVSLNFFNDGLYRTGMTQVQIDTIVNLARRGGPRG
jgi:hypothetical protein